MVNRSFDDFIEAVTRSLRLQSHYRDEIESELTDHLEERFRDLMDQGVTQEVAARQALAELGDAKMLAREFDSISRNQRRRWIMRFTTAAIVGSFVMAVLLMSMWPENSRLPMQGRTLAQDEAGSEDPFGSEAKPEDPFGAEAGSNDPFGSEDPFGSPEKANDNKATNRDKAKDPFGVRPPMTRSVEENNLATKAKLDTFIDGHIEDLSVAQIPWFFAEQVQVPVHLKLSEIENEGIPLDETTSLNIRSPIRASFALELILDEIGLDYAIRDGIIIITSESDIEYFRDIRVYNCRELLELLSSLDNQNTKTGGHDPFVGSDDGSAYGESGGSSEEYDGGEGFEAAYGTGAFGENDYGGGMAMGSSDQRRANASSHVTESIIEIVTSTISPDSWDSVGGPGTISAAYNGILVVSNNAHVHTEIEELLEKLKESVNR